MTNFNNFQNLQLKLLTFPPVFHENLFKMDLNFFIFFSLLTFIFAANPYEDAWLKFTSAKCSSSGKTMTQKCFIKAYSRKNSTLNVLVNITSQINEAKVNFEVRHKSLSNYYRTIINITFDFCKAMENKDNILMNWLLQLWSENFRNNLHKCPYKVVSEICKNFYNFNLLKLLGSN